LDAVFARFVVEGQRTVDVEVKAPYGWLVRLQAEERETPVLESA